MTILKAEQKLTKGQQMRSDNGKYTLTLQDDGNLVLSDSSGPVWASGTHGKGATRLVVQTDGNVVLYTDEDKPVWSTKTHGNPGAMLTLQNDRNLVVYSGDKAIWASKTRIKGAEADSMHSGSNNTYKVVQGDTLYTIAERFLGDGNRYREIASMNHIANPDLIRVGMMLTIPEK